MDLIDWEKLIIHRKTLTKMNLILDDPTIARVLPLDERHSICTWSVTENNGGSDGTGNMPLLSYLLPYWGAGRIC